MSEKAFKLYMVVQDSEGDFLCPSASGDVTFTRDINKAGKFDDLEVATESAEAYCDRYTIFPFYQPISKEVH